MVFYSKPYLEFWTYFDQICPRTYLIKSWLKDSNQEEEGKGKKNLVNQNQGWEPIHPKYKAEENTCKHNPKKETKSKQLTKIRWRRRTHKLSLVLRVVQARCSQRVGWQKWSGICSSFSFRVPLPLWLGGESWKAGWWGQESIHYLVFLEVSFGAPYLSAGLMPQQHNSND